jgi:hypothetical protein
MKHPVGTRQAYASAPARGLAPQQQIHDAHGQRDLPKRKRGAAAASALASTNDPTIISRSRFIAAPRAARRPGAAAGGAA